MYHRAHALFLCTYCQFPMRSDYCHTNINHFLFHAEPQRVLEPQRSCFFYRRDFKRGLRPLRVFRDNAISIRSINHSHKNSQAQSPRLKKAAAFVLCGSITSAALRETNHGEPFRHSAYERAQGTPRILMISHNSSPRNNLFETFFALFCQNHTRFLFLFVPMYKKTEID